MAGYLIGAAIDRHIQAAGEDGANMAVGILQSTVSEVRITNAAGSVTEITIRLIPREVRARSRSPPPLRSSPQLRSPAAAEQPDAATSPTSPNPEWRPGAIVLMPRDAGHPEGAITLYRQGVVGNDGTVHRNHPPAPPQYGFEAELSWVIRAGMQRHGHLPRA